MLKTRGLVALVATLVRHPHLWATALRQGRLLTPRQWWRQWPPLPLPDRDYWGFRMETAYGSPSASPTAADVVAYLHWCQRHRLQP